MVARTTAPNRLTCDGIDLDRPTTFTDRHSAGRRTSSPTGRAPVAGQIDNNLRTSSNWTSTAAAREHIGVVT
jgi:hypothetical protein